MTLENKIIKFGDKWLMHSFSSGSYHGRDYIQFQKEAKVILRAVAAEAGYDLHQFNKNHYEFSAVLKERETGAFAYISIPDVRGFTNEWFNHILYRQMRHAKDWCGLSNHYTTLFDLSANLQKLYHI